MAVVGLYRGSIPFFATDESGTIKGLVWVKGSVQPYRKDTIVRQADALIYLEVATKKVFCKQQPQFAGLNEDEIFRVYFINPTDNKIYLVENTADYNWLAGRQPKHTTYIGTREGYLSFPTAPDLTPSANSVDEYEKVVTKLKVITQLYL